MLIYSSIKKKIQQYHNFKKLYQSLQYNLFLKDTNLKCLENVSSVLIRQENNVGDIGLGLSEPFMYKYTLYEYDQHSESPQQKLLYCKEIDPPHTNYWAGKRRQINLEASEPFSTRRLLRFTKPVQFSYFSKNRPYLQLEYIDEDQNPQFIGEIRSPFNWKTFNYQIFDEKYDIEYSVVADMRFKMLFSRFKLRQFMECNFIIYEKEDTEKKVGEISSLFYYHERRDMTIGDIFLIKFPESSSVEQKCRIIGMSLLNDFWVYGGIPKFQLVYTFA